MCSSKFYPRSSTLIVSILQMIKEGIYAAEIASPIIKVAALNDNDTIMIQSYISESQNKN